LNKDTKAADIEKRRGFNMKLKLIEKMRVKMNNRGIGNRHQLLDAMSGGGRQWLLELLAQFKRKYLPTLRRRGDISRTREVVPSQTREVKRADKPVISRNYGGLEIAGSVPEGRDNVGSQRINDKIASVDHQPEARDNAGSQHINKDLPTCPYCSSKDTARRGLRQKKYEVQQRYFCNACQKSFVAPKAKGKQFPLKIILEGISYYNMGFSLAESCRFLKEKSGIDVKESSLANWVKEYEPLCTYSRMRPYGMKLYSPHQVIQRSRLFHRQVYEFCYHRAKTALILQEYKHARFENLREYLEAVQTECPHQFSKRVKGRVKSGLNLA